jgi:ABC-type sugar transport system ATPase subunit
MVAGVGCQARQVRDRLGADHCLDPDAPKDASTAGVKMVYQDLALVDVMDIAANLPLGRTSSTRPGPTRGCLTSRPGNS